MFQYIFVYAFEWHKHEKSFRNFHTEHVLVADELFPDVFLGPKKQNYFYIFKRIIFEFQYSSYET